MANPFLRSARGQLLPLCHRYSSPIVGSFRMGVVRLALLRTPPHLHYFEDKKAPVGAFFSLQS